MPKNKEVKFFSLKRCGPLKLKIEKRSSPAKELKVGLMKLTSSDSTSSPSTSTTVHPSTSPTATLSTSFENRPLKIVEPCPPEPMLTSTPDLTVLPKCYSLSSLPSSPAPSPIYSLPAPQNQLGPDGMSLPVPPASATPSSGIYCNMMSPCAQFRPVQPVPRTTPFYAVSSSQPVVPQPRQPTVVRLPTVPVSRAALVGYTPAPALNYNPWIEAEPTHNRPYPDPMIFSAKTTKDPQYDFAPAHILRVAGGNSIH